MAAGSDGTPIAWYDFGGDGPDLVLGHATGFCAHVWRPVVEVLAGKFHCYAYDLRGHGHSSRPAFDRSSWDWHRYAGDLIAVLAAAELHKPLSVGHSCGAATAILAEQSSPGTFSALAGFEPVMFPYVPPKGPDPERELAVRTRRRRNRFSSRAAALEAFTTRGPFVQLDQDALEAYVDHGFRTDVHGAVHLRCHPDDEAEVYVMGTAHDGFVRLPDVQCPVTVVHGEQSDSFPPDVMKAVVERLPYGRRIPMSGAGHFGALERPREFADLVVDSFASYL